MSRVSKSPHGTIVRRVRVNRTRTLQQALDAIGQHQRIGEGVLVTAPTGVDEDVEVIFVPCIRSTSDEVIDQFIPVGFRPADPWELAAVNEDDFTFADQYPNFTYWQDGNRKRCWMSFYKWYSKQGVRQGVRVYRRYDGWLSNWYLAVVREEQKQD